MSKLFYDDEFEAIRTCIERGKGYKATASMLFPTMKPESAYARLKACCNPQGDQHLSFGQVVAICKFNDAWDCLSFMCDEGGFDRPARRAMADQQAELQRAFIHAVEESRKIASQLERMTQIRAVA